MVEKRKPRPEPDDPEQARRFVDTARTLQSDETGKFFERALAGVKAGPGKERGQAEEKKDEACKK